jgi:cytidine deaminase
LAISDADRSLAEAARAAQQFSHSPHSKYKVGAALRLRDGTVVSGCNVENIVFSESCCAEKVAIMKAISEGHKEFSAIAVATDSSPPATPCGSCRQLIFHWRVGRVILFNGTEIVETNADDLLPGGFRLDP